jgi:hypothetical protein
LVTFALSFAQMPLIIREAMLRRPRRRPRAQSSPNFSDNNYLAELSGVAQRAKPEAHVEGGGRNTYKRRRMQEDSGHSGYSNSSFEENGGGLAASRDNNYLTEARAPNWGRNAPGAGAPRGNCNAWLKGLTRESMALLRLRERQRIQRLQMLVLRLEIEQAERHFARRSATPHFVPNIRSPASPNPGTI